MGVVRRMREGGGLALAALLLSFSVSMAADLPPFAIQCTGASCLWAAITARTGMGQSSDGTLLRVDTHTWTLREGRRTVRRPLRFDEDDSAAYMFCSMTRPAVIFRGGIEARAWVMYRLAPNDARGLVQYNRGSTIMYLAACHDRIVPPTDAAITAAARDLGYAVDPGAIAPVEVDRPESVLKP